MSSRGHFQFFCRSLLFVALVTGAGIAPVAWRVNAARRQRITVNAILRNHGEVIYRYETDGSEAPKETAMRRWLGADFFDRPDEVWVAEPSHLEGIQHLDSIRVLGVFKHGEGDFDFAVFQKLPNLESVFLYEQTVPHFRTLNGLPLRRLDLESCKIVSLEGISNLSNLRVLNLSRTNIQDVSMLRRLDNLEELLLYDTSVVDLKPLQEITGLRRLVLSELPEGPSQAERELLFRTNTLLKIDTRYVLDVE